VKKQLLWMLCTVFVVGALLLFWCINVITYQTEQAMSFISDENQARLSEYGKRAEQLYVSGDTDALTAWLKELEQTEETWAAVVSSVPTLEAGSSMSPVFLDGHRLGRNIEWKIHLYFKENPIMDLPFADGKTHFLIQLPARMRPGNWYPYAQIVLQVGIPLVLLSVLAVFMYGYLMSPLKQLQRATRAFSQGELDARTRPYAGFIGRRNDEITELGATFNEMAAKTERLICHQRELLSDLSHELRTPLARMSLALTYLEQDKGDAATLARLRWEVQGMGELVEDTLTLAWLDNEQPSLRMEEVELDTLLEVIAQDAAFEYPDRHIKTDLISECHIRNSNQHALSHAFENLIRNALKHTPEQSGVTINMFQTQTSVMVDVEDEGPGVPEHLLGAIFRPFYQVDEARSDQAEHETKGYGLGLALAKRQIDAVGGTIQAHNRCGVQGCRQGLVMRVELPKA
jgi:two-component system sensor histidine kinase PfeS